MVGYLNNDVIDLWYCCKASMVKKSSQKSLNLYILKEHKSNFRIKTIPSKETVPEIHPFKDLKIQRVNVIIHLGDIS